MSDNQHTQVGGDVIQADGDVMKIGRDHVDRDQITYNYYTVPPPQDKRERRNRTVMLQKVHDFWIEGVLENSLRKAVFIELGMRYQQDALADPRNLHLHRFGAPDEPLPPGTPISSVFAAVGGELLILGAPGAGKTTMLLELARDLLERAQQDETHPIPVVFNLSTWHRKGQGNQLPLAGWLVGELVDVYNVSRKVAQAWVDDDRLLLLLDGLDEVPLARRAACVEAINTFRQESRQELLPLVVCSRIADYEALDTKLRLRGAVCLQPLTQPQVADYFSNLETDTSVMQHAYTRLWEEAEALLNSADEQDQKEGEEAQQSLSTPLLLSIITLTYADQPPAVLPDDPSLRQLFGRYVERMVQPRPGQPPDPRYPPEQTTHWLGWLAARMVEHDQTVFQLEQIQPTWLTRWWQRWLYSISSGIVGGVGGFLFFCLFSWFLSGIGWMGGDLLNWLTVGVQMGLLYGLPFGGVIGLSIGLSRGKTTRSMQWKSKLNDMLRGEEIAPTTRPDQVGRMFIRNAIPGGSIVGLFSGLVFGLIVGVSIGFLDGFFFGTLFGVISGGIGGLSNGGAAFIQHFTLRLVLARNNHAPLNYVRFLDYAAGRILLRKVGGGYIFVHRMLLEYFAGVEAEQSASS